MNKTKRNKTKFKNTVEIYKGTIDSILLTVLFNNIPSFKSNVIHGFQN